MTTEQLNGPATFHSISRLRILSIKKKKTQVLIFHVNFESSQAGVPRAKES